MFQGFLAASLVDFQVFSLFYPPRDSTFLITKNKLDFTNLGLFINIIEGRQIKTGYPESIL